MSKLRKSARDQECHVQIPSICNYDPATTVLAHFNGGGGMKKSDLAASFACFDCHNALDRRTHKDLDKEWLELLHRQGNERTIQWWLDNGYIKVVK
jgi:hypothetical protein